MNNFLNKMERKFGKYAVPHLTMIMIACYVIGYVLQMINPNAADYMMLEPAYILKGQVWRIITWIIIPPNSMSTDLLGGFFTIVMLFFYLSIGNSLEKAWGDFRYNVYIFGGMLITLIAAFICYFVFSAILGGPVSIGYAFSTYYITTSIFLAFAATFPDARVMLYFVIPIKVKWLGIVYAAFIVYDMTQYIRLIAGGQVIYWVMIIAMIASLLNFVIFFLSTRSFHRFSPQEQKRRREFRQAMEKAQRSTASGEGSSGHVVRGPAPRHRCEICGRTDISNPELEFRYCSKCSGNHEYCMDHLYTHTHIK
ncbi:MAG TPA: hypothetical protein PLN48_03605 [Lachnospiraceae bacterium]|jgi:hypothetical protein|nr:hypothetical protein [Lachnospiraceae bacterium]